MGDNNLQSLSDLDDDIIIAIFGFLDVSSILALRKTCQRMQLISHLLVVWRHAFNTQVLQHGFPYPPDILLPSLPSTTLEHAVLRSCRISQFWHRPSAEPRSKASFRLKTSMGISDIYLLPENLHDGLEKRRVITVSKGIWSEVACWNLDMTGSQLFKLAEWCPKGAIFTGIAVNGKPDSAAIVALSLTCGGEQCIQILSLQHDQDEFSFQVLKTFSASYRPVYLDGDILAFSDDSSETYISNWRTGESAVLLGSEMSTGSTFEYNKCIKIIDAHDSILVVRARSIDLFPTPKLKPASEDVPIYHPTASHSFGWVDGVSVYPQHHSATIGCQIATPLYVLVRLESDDPWSSDTHTIHLYSLEPNLSRRSRSISPLEDIPEEHPVRTGPDTLHTPYIFPPIHKVSFPTLKGRLRCTDILCGNHGTGIWVQPRSAHEASLTTFDVHSSHAQIPYSVPVNSANESIIGGIFPGIMMNQSGNDDDPMRPRQNVRRIVERDIGSEANWTAMDYDEIRGLVVLGASDGEITVVEL
ncbi:hypothetical protein QCA50_012339 [Cerrena zonata]|uniref:F-box domain-containing protein n=1 Tax=Cerrena zonata TaxID=2478898 RepID=A0AAW0FYJ3_9APHY